MKPFFLLAFLLSPFAHADDKATVNLDAGGYASSGGSGRPKLPEVEVSKGFGSEKNIIPVAEQIAAVKSHLGYLTLMQKHSIDLSKEITATYTEKPLADVLKEILPKVPVKFDGADAKVTVKSLTANKARLSAVIEHLDDAAGVYFVFTEEGITVKAEPPTVP
jgi:hypothetical protein